jgi:hypothetical protein
MMREGAPPLAVSIMYCLDTEQGHIFSYNRTFGEAVRTIGWEHRAAVRAAARVVALPEGWTRDLGTTRYVFRGGLLLQLEKEWRLITSLAAYLRRVVGQEPRPIVLLLEWFHVVHLFAFCASLLAVPRRRKLSAWFVYRFGFVRTIDRVLYRALHAAIQRLLGPGQVAVFSETDTVAEELRRAFGKPVHLLPMPQIVQPHEPATLPAWATTPERQGKLVCWWPGVPAHDKGLVVVRQLAASTAPEACQVVIVADQRAHLAPAPGGCGVIGLPNNLTRAEYAGWLKTMDIALLPYLPGAYAHRTSGVFADAICMGKIPVVTGGTWMARELSRYGLDQLILDWDSPTLLADLIRIAADPAIFTGLARMRADYQAFHSVAGYAAVLERVLRVG